LANKDKKRRSRSSREVTRDSQPLAGWPAVDAPLTRWIVITLGLMLVLAILYPGPVFQNKIFLSGDAQNSNSFTIVGDRSLAQGDYPQWNPYLFAGMPSFGSLAYAKYLYPPSVVLNFLQDKLGFPPLTWLLAHLLFGGLGMAWLLSRWRLPTGALLLGAVIWLMAPKVVAWSVHGHGTKLGAAMYLPWIVGWAWRILDGKGLRAIGMVGLLLGLQLLRGHVQITYYTLLVVGWLALCHAVWPLDDLARRTAGKIRWLQVGQVLGGIALGFMIGAMLLIPVHGYSGISIRGQDTEGGGGVGLEYATGWSMAPAELATLVFPAAAGFGKATYLGAMPFNDYPSYVGILALMLAGLAWWPNGRRLAVSLLVMACLAVLVSFGNHGPGLYELLYNYLPYFNKFRIPSMILILVTFACAIQASRGATAWTMGVAPAQRPRLWPMLLMGLGAICLMGGFTSVARGPFTGLVQFLAQSVGRDTPQVLLDEAWILHRSSLVRIGLILLLAGSAMLASLKNPVLRGKFLLWILIPLVGLDLFWVDHLVIRPEQGLLQVGRDAAGRTHLVTASATEGSLRAPITTGDDADGRVIAEMIGHDRVFPLGNQSIQNIWMASGVRSLGGYHAAKLADYEQIRRRLFSGQPAGRLANWLGGSVLTIEQPLRDAEFQVLERLGLELERQPVQTGALSIYRNRSTMGRARLVTRWQPTSDLPEGDALEPFLDGIQSGTIPVRGQVYLQDVPDPMPETYLEPLPEPIFITDGLDEVVLTVRTPVPALLLLADMMAPGWKVQVNGLDRPLLRADLVLRSVALEAGEHTVRFHYSDPAVRAGLTGSLLGGILTLVLILFPLFRRFGRKIPAEGLMDSVEKVDSDD
jgi:hypothetical protein